MPKKKTWLLLALVALLGGFSLYLNRDWFARDNIQIYHRSRPMRANVFRKKRPSTMPAAVTPAITARMISASAQPLSEKNNIASSFPGPRAGVTPTTEVRCLPQASRHASHNFFTD